jgi:hypothetical protein
MTANELENESKFLKKHKKKCGAKDYKYIIYPSPIGYAISIKCNICKKEKDITDYGCW